MQAPTPVLYSPTESQTPISELVVQDERRQTFPLELVWQANALTEREMARLREFAIELINADRAKSGLAPVEPGTNQAAQHHAEDMLAGDYLGHWWLDGRKPYMVYSSSGGSSYASENVASSGWTWVEWQELDCEESTCKRPDVRAAIEKLQWNMMHDDAHADWGHRDNILGMSHRRVNIGIASNEIRVTFVQHFEGGDLEATGRPSIEGGILSLSVRNNLQGGLLHAAIGLYEDPPPQARTAAEIDALGAYCTGGGFTENCDSIAAAIRILKPPPPDEYYIDLGVNEIVADVWDEDDGYLEVVADIGRLLSESGVYTVVVWGVGEQGVSGDMLLELTVDR